MKTRPTKLRAVRFLHETASASDPIDEALVTDFLLWLGWPSEAMGDEAKNEARRALAAERL